VPRPALKIGDNWTYRGSGILGREEETYELRVNFVSEKAILAVATRKSDGREFDSTWTPEWNAVVSYSKVTYKPETRIMTFPLAPGDKHSAVFDAASQGAGNYDRENSLNVTVLGWEDVTVPAGKFRALKVEATGTFRRTTDSSTGMQQYTFWYVPEVKRWVKLNYEFSGTRGGGEELVEYKVQ
jgi:hypothetical protein